MRPLLFAALAVLVTVPVGGAFPSQFHDQQVITGPVGADVKGVASISYGVDNNGMAKFDTTSWNFAPDGAGSTGRFVYVWVEQVSGAVLKGYGVTVGVDRDDDLLATTLDPDDQVATFYASTDPCTSKDTKQCGNPRDAAAVVLVCRDQPFNWLGVPDGQYDDFWVAIHSWVSEDETGLTGDNSGFGASIGQFAVHVEYLDFTLDPCTSEVEYVRIN